MARTSSSGKKFVPSSVKEDIIPHAHNEYELGSSAKRWQKIWAIAIVATLITAGTLSASGVNVSFLNATNLNGSINASYYNITFLDTISLNQSCYPSAGTDCSTFIKYNGSCIIMQSPSSALYLC